MSNHATPPAPGRKPGTAYGLHATRADGLARLHEFLPRAGDDYARTRNDDRGPSDRGNVSMLSPYLRHRLLTEHEVVAAAIAMHGARGAQKFLEEVLWRTYFKGWLQLRPAVWASFVAERDAMREVARNDDALATRLAQAEAGTTGIDGFDDWARELAQTGYLHNHARMWFASIWSFTLRLPWTLGADFFLRHLLDADAASNTLSWRWVAGLQTPGKPYVATTDNIARCTHGRYRPTGLATNVVAIAGPPSPAAELGRLDALPDHRPALRLVTPDDLHPESLPIAADVRGVVCVRSCTAPVAWPWGSAARGFVDGAVADTASRLRCTHPDGAVEVLDTPDAHAVARMAQRTGVDSVVVAEAPVGPMADALDALRGALAGDGIMLLRVRRDWDARFWPHATRGFFPFRERIDGVLEELGMIGVGVDCPSFLGRVS